MSKTTSAITGLTEKKKPYVSPGAIRVGVVKDINKSKHLVPAKKKKTRESVEEAAPESWVLWSSTEFDFPISLLQSGSDKFTVKYGEQVTTDLSYDEAAFELGAAILHSLGSAGKLDSMPG